MFKFCGDKFFKFFRVKWQFVNRTVLPPHPVYEDGKDD